MKRLSVIPVLVLIALAFSSLLGCQAGGTSGSTTQPTGLPPQTAQSTLTTIETVEGITMVALQLGASADPSLAQDYALAQIADSAFQQVAQSEQASIISGTPLTSAQVEQDMASVLSSVLKIRASTSVKTAAKVKATPSAAPAK